ncbi:tannase/feruloyl esterase family alpha/beta hydrolase, partial [Hyphomonas pacifica]|uniref:tannase/feruloyl esterase family alpha/beta hydrolase n=1 Tax=Hyphomonas pacifica TaxID=1280941 RepID=UPI0011B9449C
DGPPQWGRAGPGPFIIDAQAALEAWVEQDTLPKYLTGRHIEQDGSTAYSRKICPYPEIAVHDESGSRTEAAAFNCEAGTPADIEPPAEIYVR